MALTFTWLDYLVLAFLVTLTLSLGIYRTYRVRRRVRRSGRHHPYAIHALVLNHQHLRVVPTLLSLLMAHQSAISILGLPSELYLWGSQWWFAGDILAIILGPLILERFILPWIYKQQLISVYEYFIYRFKSQAVRKLAASLGLLSTVFFIAINVFAPALALETVTGIPFWVNAFILAAVSMVYTWLGGMRVITWTDVGQFFVLVVGLCIVVISGARNLGGIQALFGVSYQHGRIFFADFSLDPRVRLTFWSCILSVLLHNILVFGLDQAAVTRYSSTPYLRSARHAIVWLFPLRFIILTLCYTGGVVMFSFFLHESCNPLVGQLIQSPQQLVPMFWNLHFVGEIGMQGLLFAMLCCACIGTISSGLSSSKVTIYQDFLKPLTHGVARNRIGRINRFMVMMVTLVATGLAFFVATLPGNLLRIVFTLRSCFDGPLLGLFMLGGLTRVADKRGALAGALSGLALTLGFCFHILYSTGITQPLPLTATENCPAILNFTGPYPLSIEPFNQDTFATNRSAPETSTYVMSFMWLLPMGFFTTFAVGLAASLVMRRFLGDGQRPEIDDSLLINFRNIFACDDHHRTVKDDDEEEESDEGEDALEVTKTLANGLDERCEQLEQNGNAVKLEELKPGKTVDFEC